ncbi:basic amino acid ABC transporter substrate-binding protein [Phycisphaera mikurensis]|uniref:Amino acid ABC transporter substrate binding protein n=1 Tax=Phycisphaera mikurensis (strain NBRC 102666 / KCTC 22515 / FYK2301M01) TaxID=1142394 RepID=I0IDN5_PHYMF|nr:basic amino acid ABC transporter substrate-binding protein [Phycisphaera mikurensis]MBB6441191.1 polar amino acid transport system substrate-binding protein [Phycisphaera mikurensis]BAM03373.1 amino acid ABC transporter substrate binding protein [Phycisphaera mikurensis NBRC 102666]
MNRRKLLPAVLALAAVPLSLAGCGEAGGGDAAATGGDDAARTVVVGTEPTFPPFEMKDENDVTVGFDIDLFKAIAEDQGFTPDFRDVGFDSLIPSLNSGQIDVAVSGMSITEERQQTVDFTDPYVNAGLVIATRPDTGIGGVDDLAGRQVGVNIGTTGATAAEELAAEGKIGGVQTFQDVGLSMEALVAGKVDAVINDKPVSETYAKSRPDKVIILPEVLVADDYGMAVRKGNTELLETLNAGLANVKASGQFDTIQDRWFGDDAPAAVEDAAD